MPAPSKFNPETRQKIIQALSVGASRRTAAAIAGVDHQTLARWLERGKTSAEGTRWHEFYMEAMEAEASPRMRALGIIYREMPDNPRLAWDYVQRREPGYAPPMPNVQQALAGPVVIQFSFTEAVAAPALPAGEVIEGEFVEQDDEPEPS